MTKQPIKVMRSAITTADQAAVFRLLAEGSTWPDWSPISSLEELTHPSGDDHPEGVGSIRVFKSGPFRSHEEVVRVDEPDVFAYRLVKSRVLHVRDYEARVELSPHAEGTTITWTGSFRPLFPGSGWIWKRIIGNLYEQFVEGLASHAQA